MAAANKRSLAQSIRSGVRAAPTWLRSAWQRLRCVPARLAALPRSLRALASRLRGPKVVASAAIGAALLATIVLAAIPRGSDVQTRRMALSGKDLFAALQEQQPGTARSSRVKEGDERGSGTNLIVLTEDAWEKLSVDQRNSLGSWLNDLGGRWQIRIGRGNEDNTRVLDAQPVITSELWNRQLK
jgi:hypothetical protein